MNILKSRKTQWLCAFSMLLVAGASIVMISSNSEKKAQAYYEDFKERFFLQDVLSEGDISYSVFSGNLTVENPEIRLVAAQTNGAEQFLRGIYGLFASSQAGTTEEGLAGWVKYQVGSTTGRGAAGAYIHADALKLSHDGDSKSGEIRVQLLGMDQANQYLSHKGAELVLASDVIDEIQPRAEIGPNNEVAKSNYSWGANMAVRSPATGSFLIAATGAFGTKVDLDLTISRSDDGEGFMKFVVTHRNDGSEVGRIVREAQFAALPELDALQDMLKTSLTAFIVGAYNTSTGQAILADAVSGFARKTKVESYDLMYEGFGSLKKQYSEFEDANRKLQLPAFCDQTGMSGWQSNFGAKGKGHSDSECEIVSKLVKSGSFKESYTFQPEKTLFASLFVSTSYKLNFN
ncbi:hypothetical protein H8F21_15825 [Pseudomonas sp. P66]|uniref:Uncharacterized protein n=1 Tax=Pseudomonas arcuscaelestis TaxID=2710591 RepID=A0ABS2BZJ6_9PSED|nr:hypothetical protein [Pseudomonas arcuscaelestis]MBM5459037.1 hypothetical protein [Pseudomonas arcuscaelestis]